MMNPIKFLNSIFIGIEVNFMDDVGQTLLNWASAFGTQEMVEFLCERGADVNKGQRSSSLHYAACFGRPGVAKVCMTSKYQHLYCCIIQYFVLRNIFLFSNIVFLII